MVTMRMVYVLVLLFVVNFTLFPVTARAGVGVSPGSLNFGSVALNSSSMQAKVVVTNNYTWGLFVDKISSSLPEFVITTTAVGTVIPPQGKFSVLVAFRPNAVATFNGTIAITCGRHLITTSDVHVSGTGVSAPSATTHLLTPGTTIVAFGNLLVGSSASQAISLKNTGTGSVTVSQVTVNGGGFKVAGFSGAVSLAAGQTLSLSTTFAPAAKGNTTGTISVVSTATNSPASISLSGTGVQSAIAVVPSSVNFGNVTVGVTNTQTMTIQNPGTANLTVTQASLSGTNYSLSGLALPLSIAPGSSAAFNVAFDPTLSGGFSGSLTVASNAPTPTLTVPISGTGIAVVRQLSASPASLNFGSLITGTSGTQTVTLTNTGNSTVTISQISASGTGFSAGTIALPISVAAGQSTSFSAIFDPASTGNLSGSIVVTSNASNSPLTVALTGTGSSPASHSVTLSWNPGSSSYSGFNVYRGTVSGGPYARVDSSVISTTTYIDASVAAGQTYYYVATEIDSTGVESSYSSEVKATIP